jgi:hypothetical protein
MFTINTATAVIAIVVGQVAVAIQVEAPSIPAIVTGAAYLVCPCA